MPIRFKSIVGEVLAQKLEMRRISLDSTQTNILNAPKPRGYSAGNDPGPKAGAKFHGNILARRGPDGL
jgi:hypothetical protein